MAYIVTENIPLNMPVPGTREPAQIALLNENCVTLSNHDHTEGKALSVGRLRSGIASNLPAAGSAGNVYFATDTGRFYVDTGTAWVEFITSGGQATVTGWTLVDPIIRDTLSFGPEGSGTVDATITRTGQGALTIPGTLTLNADAGEPGLVVSKPSTAALTGAHPDWPYIQFGPGSMIRGQGMPGVGTVVVSGNSLFKADNKAYAVFEGAAAQIVVGGQGLYLYTAPSATAGAEQVMTERFSVATEGMAIISPAAAANALQVRWADGAGFYIAKGASTATNTRLYSSHSMELDPANNYVTPARNGVVNLGADNFPWLAAYAHTFNSKAPTNVQMIQLNGKADVINDVADHLRWRRLPSGSTFMRWIYSIPGVIFDETVYPTQNNVLDLGQSGGIWKVVHAGAVHAGVYALSLNSASSIHFNCNVYAHPLTDATMYLGHSSFRWITGYFSSAPVVGSSLDLKEDIAPLDPAACVEAVLGTDWVAYHVKPPPPPARGEKPELSEQQRAGLLEDTWDREQESRHAEYLQAMVETEPSRHQKGYVLQSPDHKVHDLFGLPDRKNRSDGADLAVVACALQHALARIAALEAASGQAPAA